MSILSLFAKLSLDGKGFKAGMKEAESQAHHFGKEVMAELKGAIAGAFGAGAVIALGHHIVETAARVKQLSEQFAVSTDDVQKWDAAAQAAGLSFDDVGAAIIKVGLARKKAATDNETRSTFQSFGIGWERINDAGISNLEILQAMLESSKGLAANSMARAELDELAGKRAEKLLGIMERMKTEHPAIMTEEDIESIHRAEKAVNRLKQSATVFGSGLLGDYLRQFQSGTPIQERLKDIANVATLGIPKAVIGWAFKKTGQTPAMPAAQEETETAKPKPPGSYLSRDYVAEAEETKVAEAYNKLQEAALKLEMAKLSVGEQRKRVEGEITNLIAAQSEYGASEKEYAEIGTQIQTKRLELYNMDKQHSGIQEDAMQKIGNQLGNAGRLNAQAGYLGAGNQTHQIAVRHLEVAQRNVDVSQQVLEVLQAIKAEGRGAFNLGAQF